MLHAKQRSGAAPAPLLLAAILVVAAIMAAPPLLAAARSAAGLEGVREPYTYLTFTDSATAAAGFSAGAPVGVEVGNETGETALLRLVVRDGADWQTTIDVELADGTFSIVDVAPPPGARRITVEIEGRGVFISAMVRP